MMRNKIILLTAFFYYYRGYLTRFTLKQLIRKLPFVQKKLQENTNALEASLQTDYKNMISLPDNGLDIDTILKKTDIVKPSQSINLISGIIYHQNNDHFEKLLKVFQKYRFSNPLHPDIFPEIREMEIDIIKMVSNMFNGDSNTCGNVTSGGTESILLAVYTYREWGRMKYGIVRPNIVAFTSVHPAFDKACHYFGITLRKVSSLNWMKMRIDWNTVCVVGSAPTYGYGIIDPIEEIAKHCLYRKVPFHVDCCMGGFLMPFIESNPVSFTTKGVTSISADSHKYGNCFKGSSILLFSSWEFKQHQHFIKTDWEGGMYATPTLLGSKNGALIATTWASMLLMGKRKYKQIALTIKHHLNTIKSTFENSKDIEIIGTPLLNIIAFRSKSIDIYKVVSYMKDWNLSVLTNPPAFHFCITSLHNHESIEKFNKDLLNAIKLTKNNANEKLTGTLAIYGSAAKIENSLFTRDVVNQYVGLLSSKNIFKINGYL